MVRRFFRDSAVYALPAALSRGISFLLFPLFAHHFSPTDYGVLDIVLLLGSLASVTVALEVSQGLGRYIAGEDDEGVRRDYASTALWFTVGAYTAFILAVEAAAVPITHLVLGPDVQPGLLRVAGAWMWLTGVLYLAQNQLRWELRPVAYATASAIMAVATALMSALLVLVVHMSVMGAILGQLIGAAAALVFVLAVSRGSFAVRFDREKWRHMVGFSLPLVPSGVGVFLNAWADRLVIQQTRSLADVGVYGVGFRWAMIVSLVLVGFQGAAMPLFLARHRDPSMPADVARIFRVFAALAIAIFVALSVLATPALRILAAAPYQRAADVVPLLVVSAMFAGMYMFAPGLAIAKDMSTMAKVTVIAGIANAALALALVPPFGIVGAGVATATTSLWWFGSLMRASQRRYPVPHRWGSLVTGFLSASALVAASMIVLPSDRADALDPATLVARGLFVIAGIALAAYIAFGSVEPRRVVDGALGVLRRMVAQPRGNRF
jgi:O-antigen/teichoic acid export membrane protein